MPVPHFTSMLVFQEPLRATRRIINHSDDALLREMNVLPHLPKALSRNAIPEIVRSETRDGYKEEHLVHCNYMIHHIHR